MSVLELHIQGERDRYRERDTGCIKEYNVYIQREREIRVRGKSQSKRGERETENREESKKIYRLSIHFLFQFLRNLSNGDILAVQC